MTERENNREEITFEIKEHIAVLNTSETGWTREVNLDAVFVTAMAFARSRALNDEGGTFGKQIRSSLDKK